MQGSDTSQPAGSTNGREVAQPNCRLPEGAALSGAAAERPFSLLADDSQRGMRVSPAQALWANGSDRRVAPRRALRRKVSFVASTIEHPDIRYVVYPVHFDGSLTGAKPRLRHDPDCSHFEWGDGTILGTPELATVDQMRTLRACKTCVAARAESSKDAHIGAKEGRIGEVCPTCNQAMPLTSICDNCS